MFGAIMFSRGYARMGVTHYIMRENLIFYDSPNCQIKVLAKFSGYTVAVLFAACTNDWKLRTCRLLAIGAVHTVVSARSECI